VAEALAALHAYWWGSERLSAIGAAIPREHEISAYIEHTRPGLEPMIDTLGDTLDPVWRHALAEIFARHPAQMLERTRHGAGFTLVHGEPNPGNILAPIDGAGPVYLVDRQPFDWSLTTWLGVGDIAYVMVHWWESELRREWELPILRTTTLLWSVAASQGTPGSNCCATIGSPPCRASMWPSSGVCWRRIARGCAGTGSRSFARP
jgi:hypothetical protein